jgi:aldehyde:ferredoxin oxidoreductase
VQNEFGNILRIDLTTREVRSTREKEEVLKQYLGGSGYGAYLLCQDLDNSLDPFDPRSPLLFLSDPLTGTAVPTSGRHIVIGRSPLTGIWGEASVGGHWGRELRRAGYDGKEGGTAQNLPPLHIMLSEYYEYRGWNEFGIPHPDKLESLKIRPIGR